MKLTKADWKWALGMFGVTGLIILISLLMNEKFNKEIITACTLLVFLVGYGYFRYTYSKEKALEREVNRSGIQSNI